MPNAGYIARASTRRSSVAGCSSSRRWSSPASPMFVAFLPVAAKLVDRGSQTTVAVVASDELADRDAERPPDAARRGPGAGSSCIRGRHRAGRRRAGADRDLDAAIVAIRRDDGSLAFSFHLGETMGQQQIGNLSLGVFGVAVLDYSARNPVVGVPAAVDRRVPIGRR